jgi:hypothetical protein
MAPADDDVSCIRDNGWRQGSIFPATLTSQLREQNHLTDAEDGDLFFVLSHDCDVTNNRLDVEPYCDVVRVRCVPQDMKDGTRFWGKSPRRYQFSDDSSGTDLYFEVRIHDVARIPRRCLVGATPDDTWHFSRENIHSICRWISRRYVRASFPDAFNERTARALQNVRQSLKRHGDVLEGLYVVVADDELAAGQDYEIIVWVTMREELYRSPEHRTKAQRLVDEFETHLADCDGICVSEVELRSEADVSLADIRKLKRWDFDDLSLRTGSESTLPPAD